MSAEKKAYPSSYIAMAEQAAKLITVAATVLLMMSICYDFSFLRALGLSLNEVPSSTAEHVRSALLWVPYFALLVLAGFGYELFMKRLEDGLSEEEILARVGPKIKSFRKASEKILPAFFALVALTSPILATDSSWIYLLFMFGWCALAMTVVAHKRMGARFSPLGAATFVILPLVFGFVGYL